MVPSRRLCDVLFLGLHDCNIAVVLVVALPPMSEVSGFAHAFVAQMGHVYLVLLAAFFFLRSALNGCDCQ